MDPAMDTELKSLRKRLYLYHNRLLEIEKTSRRSQELYEYTFGNKRRKLDEGEENSSDVAAFEESFAPLQNEYILEMLARYLPSQDVRKCRLVCRLWNIEMNRCLSARKALIVTEEECPEAELALKHSKKSNMLGVGTLCLFDIPSTSSLSKRLMTSFGWTLSGLKLEECGRTAQDLANIFLKLAPNLESFSYKERASPDSQRISTFSRIKNLAGEENSQFYLPQLKRLKWDEEFGKVELEEIASVCPKLIELEYRNAPVPSSDNYKGLRWDSLSYLRFAPRDELRDEYLVALTQMQLKLRRLALFGVTPTPFNKSRMQNLSKFLLSISGTLEELELAQHYSIDDRHRTTFHSPFPVKLPNLEVLNLDFPILKTAEALEALPKLAYFECRAKCSRDWDYVAKNGFSKKNLHMSHLCLGSIGEKCLRHFASSFKMCSTLEVEPEHIDDNAMRVIIQGFPQLEQLKIARMTTNTRLPLTDSGLSGFASEDCKRLLEKGLSHPRRRSSKSSAIHDLKKLIRLEIYADSSKLTDIAIVHGISQCKKLAILGLPHCNLSDISLKAIRDNLKLTLLDVPNLPKFTEAGIASLKSVHKDMIMQSGVLYYQNKIRF